MDAEKGWLSKRKFERISDTLKVAFYPIESGSMLITSDDYKDTTIDKLVDPTKHTTLINAMTEDISQGGLSITSEKQMVKGQQLVIDLFFPKFNKPAKLLAEIRMVESNTPGSYRYGLQILSISKSDLSRIEQHIMFKKNGL